MFGFVLRFGVSEFYGFSDFGFRGLGVWRFRVQGFSGLGV